MFNSDLIYYANHLFVSIYAFIQSDIERAVLKLLLLVGQGRLFLFCSILKVSVVFCNLKVAVIFAMIPSWTIQYNIGRPNARVSHLGL